MDINAKQKQMDGSRYRGAAYNGPPYWRYRWACLKRTPFAQSAVPGSQLRLAAGNTTKISKKKKLQKSYLQNLQTSTETTFQRTQTRSWAPSGPVRIQRAAKLRSRHRAGVLKIGI